MLMQWVLFISFKILSVQQRLKSNFRWGQSNDSSEFKKAQVNFLTRVHAAHISYIMVFMWKKLANLTTYTGSNTNFAKLSCSLLQIYSDETKAFLPVARRARELKICFYLWRKSMYLLCYVLSYVLYSSLFFLFFHFCTLCTEGLVSVVW